MRHQSWVAFFIPPDVYVAFVGKNGKNGSKAIREHEGIKLRFKIQLAFA